jgi:hypothetical protein
MLVLDLWVSLDIWIYIYFIRDWMLMDVNGSFWIR